MNEQQVVDERMALERKIVGKIVEAALAEGNMLSVYDGEEYPIKRSRDYDAIMGAIMSTDEDVLRIRDADGNSLGSILLVYGNDGWDVVCDYSGELSSMMEGVDEYIESLGY